MNAHSRKTGIKTLVLGLLLAAVLLGGVGITAVAAQSALPGDALYGIKTSIEDTRLNLAADAGSRAQMQMSFAERRLAEISALVDEGRYSEVGSAVLAFETGINGALVELETIAQADPARAARLAAEITTALSSYAGTLSQMAVTVPESVRPEVKRALDTAQLVGDLGRRSSEVEITGTVESIGQGAWVIDGQQFAVDGTTEIKGSIQVGDFVKVHLVSGAGGSQLAREIELTLAGSASGNENSNSNDNGNENDDDDNGNLNSNDDLGDDDNLNGNEAGDDDSDANSNESSSNANSNDDDGGTNTNTNTNDDSGTNTNTNTNDNDDHGGNGNDNSDDDNSNDDNSNDDSGDNENSNDDNP